jgi:hypothetical protein
VDDTLGVAGQGFAHMGGSDIRKKADGNVDFCIQRQILSWELQDDSPNPGKPIPVQIIMVIISLVFREHHSEASQDIADMATISVFYLLRSGEYTGTTSNGTVFRLCDLQ